MWWGKKEEKKTPQGRPNWKRTPSIHPNPKSSQVSPRWAQARTADGIVTKMRDEEPSRRHRQEVNWRPYMTLRADLQKMCKKRKTRPGNMLARTLRNPHSSVQEFASSGIFEIQLESLTGINHGIRIWFSLWFPPDDSDGFWFIFKCFPIYDSKWFQILLQLN